MKWEYHFCPIDAGPPEMEAKLKNLGADGWELTVVYQNVFVLKRPSGPGHESDFA
jgi:hypothetical protein